MLKDEMLESIQNVKEILEQCEFKKTTKEQVEILRENFNRGFNLEYCQDGGYIFLMHEDDFKSFEYYMGMEYETDNIEIKINLEGYVLVVYFDTCERAIRIFDLLEGEDEE